MGLVSPVPGLAPQPGMGILAMMTSIGAVPPPLPLQALPLPTPPIPLPGKGILAMMTSIGPVPPLLPLQALPLPQPPIPLPGKGIWT
jgi:hypothetical protein